MCDISMSMSRTLNLIFIILTQFRSDSNILFKSDSDVTQMCFNSLCIITLKCVSSHLILQKFCSDLIQMWLKFISVSSVHHHIKMRFISSHFTEILLKSDSDVIQIYFSLICASSY